MSTYEKRTDIHRRGAIQPEFYTYVGWYTLRALAKKGSPAQVLRASVEAWQGSEEAQDFKAMQWGDWGQCAVCGARYVMGEVWKHKETMDHIHVGWECALKYRQIVASGADWSAIKDERDRWLKGQRAAAKLAEKTASFLAQNPGLAEALETDHHISRDLKFNLAQWGNLTPGQVALAYRLRDQVAVAAQKRAAQQIEAKVAAPTGRRTIRGVVVSLKQHESERFGLTLKMTVKVQTAEGVWLAWGTVPGNIAEKVGRGDEVQFDGELEQGREPHFAFFRRPTKAEIVRAATPVAS